MKRLLKLLDEISPGYGSASAQTSADSDEYTICAFWRCGILRELKMQVKKTDFDNNTIVFDAQMANFVQDIKVITGIWNFYDKQSEKKPLEVEEPNGT